jgi:hypothetical protein
MEKNAMYVVSNQPKAQADNSYMRPAMLTATVVAAIAVIAPAIGLSKSMGQVWPLVMMAAVVTAGMVLGTVLHQKLNDDDEVVQIPFSNVPNNVVGHNFKQAA